MIVTNKTNTLIIIFWVVFLKLLEGGLGGGEHKRGDNHREQFQCGQKKYFKREERILNYLEKNFNLSRPAEARGKKKGER